MTHAEKKFREDLFWMNWRFSNKSKFKFVAYLNLFFINNYFDFKTLITTNPWIYLLKFLNLSQIKFIKTPKSKSASSFDLIHFSHFHPFHNRRLQRHRSEIHCFDKYYNEKTAWRLHAHFDSIQLRVMRFYRVNNKH